MSAAGLLALGGFTNIGAQAVRAAAAHQQRYEQLRWAGLNDDQTRAELGEFMAYAQSVPWPVERSWWDWQVRRRPEAPANREYDDEGEPIRPLFYPFMTVTRRVQDDALAEAYNAAGRRLYGTDMHPLLRDHGIDRCFT